MQKLIHKWMKKPFILSNTDGNMNVRVHSRWKRKVVCSIHYVNAMWVIPLSSNILLKSSCSSSSTVNLMNRSKSLAWWNKTNKILCASAEFIIWHKINAQRSAPHDRSMPHLIGVEQAVPIHFSYLYDNMHGQMPNKRRQQHHVHEIQRYVDLFEHHNVMPVKKTAHNQQINLSLTLNAFEPQNFCLKCKPARLRHAIFVEDEILQPYQLPWIRGRTLSRVHSNSITLRRLKTTQPLQQQVQLWGDW